jgi:hypothetical protein
MNRGSLTSWFVVSGWLVFLVFVAGVLACAPDLPAPAGVASPPRAPGDEGGIELTIDPPAPLDAVPPVLRLRLSFGAGPAIDHQARIYVIEGEVGPAHLRQIERDALSKALSARLVPALVWADEEHLGVIHVAPTVPLEAGATYVVAGGDPPFSFDMRVLEDDPAAWMDRVWPPVDGAATRDLGVWCGAIPLDPSPVEVRLEPSGPRGTLLPGAVPGAGARCVRFEASSPSHGDGDADASNGGLIGPPALELPSGLVRLDPRPFTLDLSPEPVPRIECETEEIPFGPGCAQIFDDRLIGRSPDAPLLWVVSAVDLGLDEVFATASGDPFVISLLPPLTPVLLDVTVINAQGEIARAAVSATTLPPMPHVILNEVMANPLGAEPEQEWVEIMNDGSVTADLTGYVLADVGGKTILPPGELPPGAVALITNESYIEEDDGLDAPPEEGTLILRVPKLGKDGLSNSGEPLKLVDSSGRVVSRMSASLKPKAGWSVVRLSPSAPDGLASSFALAPPSPGAKQPAISLF